MSQKGPREKLLKHGSAELEDAELLAVIFGHGFKNMSALKLSQQLLHTHKSLRRLLAAPYYDIIKQPGLGTAKYCQLHAAAQISTRILREPLTRSPVLDNPKNAQQYIRAALRDYPYEVFACMFLDYHHQLIEFEILSRGTVNFTFAQPRHIVQRALHFNASGAIVAHNHPSGSAEPSDADIAVTHSLAQSLALFEITLWDHLIIGDQAITSLSELGLIPPHL